MLAVSAAAVLLHVWQLKKSNKLRAAFPSLVALALCASLPIVAWLAWCKYNFGDFTGTAAKVHFLGWTHKSFAEWWSHPIFTPRGLWTFVSDLLATFWQGEMMWHRLPLTLPLVDLFLCDFIRLFGRGSVGRHCAARQNCDPPHNVKLCGLDFSLW
ncbi:MAG: hypothetical protein WDM76_08625 [Limisphaerales bacterium]